MDLNGWSSNKDTHVGVEFNPQTTMNTNQGDEIHLTGRPRGTAGGINATLCPQDGRASCWQTPDGNTGDFPECPSDGAPLARGAARGTERREEWGERREDRGERREDRGEVRVQLRRNQGSTTDLTFIQNQRNGFIGLCWRFVTNNHMKSKRIELQAASANF